jgi:hypothetical protein
VENCGSQAYSIWTNLDEIQETVKTRNGLEHPENLWLQIHGATALGYFDSASGVLVCTPQMTERFAPIVTGPNFCVSNWLAI